MFDDTTQNIIVEGNEGYKKAQSFMKTMMPSTVKVKKIEVRYHCSSKKILSKN